ncbi:GNAT family N-acetyltransferase [uncultured Tateyamaria sp.]|uniref:GNAT family N-acetyltransferase n=1 Tax=uncultured Tateyamaria sp. TaxID=455651 RepID=UPI002607DCC6|nr:GNAT family N-acetyltransferase [uncultured Tateyamaria sp.]
MSAHIRPARSTDAGAVGGILSEFIDTTPWMPRLHSRAEDVGFAGHMIDQGWVYVAEQDGHVAGFAARNGPEVHALYVAAKARRTGLGSALLRTMQEQTDRLDLWTFQANLDAQAFYTAHGFCEVTRTDGTRNDEGLPDIHLTWTKDAAP